VTHCCCLLPAVAAKKLPWGTELGWVDGEAPVPAFRPVVSSPPTRGLPEQAPFDAINVTAVFPTV
jgi:hypothetical protein